VKTVKTESPRTQLDALGQYIRSQRKNAELSLRELAEKTGVSNPYLSQLERGLHEPSMRVLSAIAEALEVSIETLLSRAGLLRGDEGDLDGEAMPDTPVAIAGDPLLTGDQRAALLAVYQSYVEGNRAAGRLPAAPQTAQRPMTSGSAVAEPSANDSSLEVSGDAADTAPALDPEATETASAAKASKPRAAKKAPAKSGAKPGGKATKAKSAAPANAATTGPATKKSKASKSTKPTTT